MVGIIPSVKRKKGDSECRMEMEPAPGGPRGNGDAEGQDLEEDMK